MDHSETLHHLNQLSNEDLVAVYYTSIRVLKDRGIYNTTKQNIRNYKVRAKAVQNKIPNNRTKASYSLLFSPTDSVLIDIMNDDWSDLFLSYDNEVRNFYVYYHSLPYCKNDSFQKNGEKLEFFGQPFYIGKGTGDRYKSLNRNKRHTDVLNGLLSTSFERSDICHILFDELTEREAMEIESKLITFFGCKNEIKKKWLHGKYGGQLLNTDYGVRPEWINEFIRETNKL